MAQPSIPTREYRVQSVARAAFMLLEIARSNDGLTPREVSEALGIHQQTTYHLLHTLTSVGLLSRRKDRYILGLRCATIGEAFNRHLSAPEYLGPAVREIAARTGETAQAVGWHGGEIVALSIARGAFPVQAAESSYGTAEAAHARASGKLMLALASPAVRAEYLERNPLHPRTAKTIVDPQQFEEELALIREQGYAVDIEEFWEGLCCMAVPLDLGLSDVCFGISAPTARFEEHFDRYLDEMRSIARSALSSGQAPGGDGQTADQANTLTT